MTPFSFSWQKGLRVFSILAIVIVALAAAAKDGDKDKDCKKPDPIGRVIAGSESAPLTIEEFADFQCLYCAKGSRVMERVLRHYPGKIRLVFRGVALPFHLPVSETANRAFGAIWLQDPGYARLFQEELFNQQDRLKAEGESVIFEVAKSVGADVEKLKADMNSETVGKFLEEDRQKMQALGITGTPSFLIGSELVVGALPFEELQKVIDKQLGQTK